jgi:single-strand DNA-binding protein
MSKTLNKVTLIGRLGLDPEIKVTPSGVTVANLSIATNEIWIDKNTQQKQEKTEWHRVICWNKLAQIVQQYLKKGNLVYVEGKLQTRSYESNGVKSRK